MRKMRWRKLGLVYGPDGSMGWARTHAMLPTPFKLNSQIIRVFVTCCDEEGVGRPGYVDVSARNPAEVLHVCSNPVLDIGRPGTFDENGVATCSVVTGPDGKLFMYYVGFELGTKVRYRLLTGLAVSEDGGCRFQRLSPIPVLERTAAELYFRCGPCCVTSPDGFRLWYVAGSDWVDVDGRQMPVYDIRYSESADGIHWPDIGQVQISITDADEHGFGRPYVLRKPSGGWCMFYSVRRKSLAAYRMGYAESEDGNHWHRMDDRLNLDVTPGSFDSEAIMYAAPIEVDGQLFAFYNGNQFGRDGFAVAVLEEE